MQGHFGTKYSVIVCVLLCSPQDVQGNYRDVLYTELVTGQGEFWHMQHM